ncbi:hypothetical protein VMCG_09745 [Cytospora schulzeri]|uniref:Uncharacterized protein n=1 Tax=Cytospora schulzeri TaxID=448051 RepID=A0A423VHE8_9PEZI|nr:hypothetical protein VMCG_09745 [Valsa malicola]
MSSPSKSRVQRQRDHFDRQFDRSSPPKIDFDHDTDLFPPTSRYLRDRKDSGSGSGSISSTSTGTPERERGNPIITTANNNATTYPNYYDYSENGPPLNIQTQQQKQQEANEAAMANMAMQVPLQQQQGGRLVDNSRPQPPVTTAQMAAAARIAAANGGGGGGVPGGNGGGGGRNARPPSYAGSTHAQRSPEEPVFPPNKVDLDAARYRQTQQRRPQGKDGRPSTNGSGAGAGAGGRPQSSGIGGGGGGPGGGIPNIGTNNNNNNNSPGSDNSPPMLSPGAAAHIQRLPTPSLATSVLQPLDAKVVEYGTLMNEAQGEMARLDDEMRQLQERQREAEGRFLEAKSRHDEYRRQYQDVERALKGDFINGGMAGNGGGGGMMGPGMRGGPGGAPPVPPVPHMGERQMTDGGRMGGGPGPGQHRPAMASQRTVSAHSDQPSMMSQDSVRTQKKGRFSRIFGV